MSADKARKVRLFTGIELDEPSRQLVSDISDSLSRKITGVKWVPRENYHVTLKFLGWVDPGAVRETVESMRMAAVHLPLRLRIGEAGAFPSLSSARVLWVGAVDLDEKVERVFGKLDKAAQGIGVRREKRRYHPHVTIGRSGKKPVRVSREDLLLPDRKVILDVKEITLFRSEFKSSGVSYTVIERAGGPGGETLEEG